MFEYQGHWVKVKVTLVKWAFWTVRHQILFLTPTYGVKHRGHSHNKVKIIFEIKVIPESNSKCLDFYPQAGSWLTTEYILVYDFLIFISFNNDFWYQYH